MSTATRVSNRTEVKRAAICCVATSRRKSSRLVPGNRCFTGSCCLRFPKRRLEPSSSAWLFNLKRLKDKAVTAFCLVSLRKTTSLKVSSSEKAKPAAVANPDSHRSEAIEACIQYINSSASSSSTLSSSSSSSSTSSSGLSIPNSNPVVSK